MFIGRLLDSVQSSDQGGAEKTMEPMFIDQLMEHEHMSDQGGAEKTTEPMFIDESTGHEQMSDEGSNSTSEESLSSESPGTEYKQCRFGSSALETVPATPVGA